MSWMQQEIAARGGAVSFREFMELALYHPDRGYYEAAGRLRVGRRGDYLTAPSASRWYGVVVARCLRRLADRLGRLTLVDLGSGDGSFIAEVSARVGGERLRRVVGVERSAALRRRFPEGADTAQCPVEVVREIEAVDFGEGAIVLHASELYDALCVHRVRARANGLYEFWVGVEGDALCWHEEPAPRELCDYFAGHGIELEIGQVAEVNLDAGPQHQSLLQRSGERGVALVLDYGYEARRLYDARGRAGGTLACYRRHRMSRDPLAFPGEQDITSHVNWDDLLRAARVAGWTTCGLWSLAEFLVRGGLAEEIEGRGLGMEAELNAETVSERQEIKRLLDPEGMGSDLKMLVQAGGAAAAAVEEVLGGPLPGF